MNSAATTRRKPQITITQLDHEKLSRLAQSVATRSPDISEELLGELDRARIVTEARLPKDVVRMGSSLSYSTDTGEVRQVTLVFPAEADIAAGKISILTPIGTALIGLARGQSMEWEARDGRVRRLKVESVEAGPSDTPLQRAS
ncbi:MAG: nucleoside diphosphate kinase regulator [Rhizobiaceae bacterium]|nr:nucleoside diphosphate kinase regulator [Rhizobiaceae bacterium]